MTIDDNVDNQVLLNFKKAKLSHILGLVIKQDKRKDTIMFSETKCLKNMVGTFIIHQKGLVKKPNNVPNYKRPASATAGTMPEHGVNNLFQFAKHSAYSCPPATSPT